MSAPYFLHIALRTQGYPNQEDAAREALRLGNQYGDGQILADPEGSSYWTLGPGIFMVPSASD